MKHKGTLAVGPRRENLQREWVAQGAVTGRMHGEGMKTPKKPFSLPKE